MFEFIEIPNPLPFVPFLVVINTTPFAALEPYNAAALGPFNTEMDSISSGLMSVIPPPVTVLLYTLPPDSEPDASIGIPSTTMSA